LKALSLTQPWASLVAAKAKRIETRSWHTAHRGEIAIHAAKGFPGYAKDYARMPKFLKYLRRNEAGQFYVEDVIKGLPLGAIIATAHIDMCLPTESDLRRWRDYQPEPTEDEYHFGDYSAGRFMWILTNIVALPEPIVCKGALGLWSVPKEIEAKIRSTSSASPNEHCALEREAAELKARQGDLFAVTTIQ